MKNYKFETVFEYDSNTTEVTAKFDVVIGDIKIAKGQKRLLSFIDQDNILVPGEQIQAEWNGKQLFINPVVKQQTDLVVSNNDKKPTGFQIHPEHINRNGRPKTKSLRELLREVLEVDLPETRKALVKRLISLGLEGDRQAINDIIDHVDGKQAEPQNQNITVTRVEIVDAREKSTVQIIDADH